MGLSSSPAHHDLGGLHGLAETTYDTSPNALSSPTRPPAPLTGAWIAGRLARIGRESLYVLGGFPLAVIGFVSVVTGLSLALGLLITFVGVPILIATVFGARGLANIERSAARLALGREPVAVEYRRGDQSDSVVRRGLLPLADGQSWLDLVHALIVFPVAVLVFCVAVTWWTLALAGTTWALWGWSVPSGDDLPALIGLGSSYPARAAFYTVVGLAALVTLPWVMTTLAWVRAILAELLLIAPSKLRSQVDHLEARGDAARAAEETALRRLERDIHDGPQQRLVRMSMDLGRARAKVGETDPELGEVLGDVQRQTSETLEELRALSRGIAPPILADRGLEAALQELAVRSTIPTTVVVDLSDIDDDRPDSHVETAAYFVASEALTNAMKHSQASSVRIWVDTHFARYGKMLRVQVTDDGVGGAHVSKGHGLAGLAQRMQAVDGRLDVDSAPGGPTTITAEVPCG